MKNFVKYICTTCQRTIDKRVDLRRAVPDRCTITLGCEGRLVPVQYQSAAEIAVRPKLGVTDWYPRGTKLIKRQSVQEEVLLNTATSADNQLVVAALLPVVPTPNSTLEITFAERSDSPTEFRHYVFYYEMGVTVVSGTESGAGKKTLRYSLIGPDPDIVEVFVNGERREEGTGPNDYQLNDGTLTSAVPANTIRFNSPVSGATVQIDVVVSKAQAVSEQTITFIRNGSPLAPLGGAWQNVSEILRPGSGAHYTFTHALSPASGLRLNSILYPKQVVLQPGSSPISLSICQFLLARRPYSQVDRYHDIFVRLSDIDGQADYLKYHKVDGAEVLEVTERTIITSYPPANLIKFTAEETLKVPPGSFGEQITVDGRVVIGPDT